MNKQQAEQLKHGAVIYSAKMRGKDRRPVRVHVTGKCHTFKQEPDRYMLPVQHMSFHEFFITPKNEADWCVTEEEAVAEHITRMAEKRSA